MADSANRKVASLYHEKEIKITKTASSKQEKPTSDFTASTENRTFAVLYFLKLKFLLHYDSFIVLSFAPNIARCPLFYSPWLH